MLTPMSVPDRRARASSPSRPSSRSADKGGASQPEFERDLHQGPIKRAVPPQQLRGAFWPDPGRARQFVRRITAERNEVRHLVWINAISLPDLFGPDAREFATPRRVEDRRARRGELKGIPIATGHQGGATTAAEPVEPADNLDLNGVDTELKAAAAAMSRATSGIQYEGAQSGANYGLYQGQTVDETGPDGRSRRVRILPTAF